MKMNVKRFIKVKGEEAGGHYVTVPNYEIDVTQYKKSDLVNKAAELMKDIFDNYDKPYTKDEKEKIIRLINQMNELNISLDYYDKTKKSFWDWMFGK